MTNIRRRCFLGLGPMLAGLTEPVAAQAKLDPTLIAAAEREGEVVWYTAHGGGV